MDLKKTLLTAHSRAQADLIAGWAVNTGGGISRLVGLLADPEYRIVQRVAWPLSLIAEERPELLHPHLEELLAKVAEPGVPQALKRNTLRILVHTDVPAPLHGLLLDTCFRFLEDPAEDIAIRSFALTLLERLAATYPEIKNELYLIAEEIHTHTTSSSLRNKAGKLLRRTASLPGI